MDGGEIKAEFGKYRIVTIEKTVPAAQGGARLLLNGKSVKLGNWGKFNVTLTIKGYDGRFKTYLLKFPNHEVRYSFMDFLVPYYTFVAEDERGLYIGKFVRELRSGDVDSFLNRLQAFFADFPYELNEKIERHYQVVFYLVFKLMGQFTHAEVHSISPSCGISRNLEKKRVYQSPEGLHAFFVLKPEGGALRSYTNLKTKSISMKRTMPF